METNELEEKGCSFVERAKTITVKDEAGYLKAAEELLGIKSLRKEINETFDHLIKKAHETHKEAVAEKKRHEEPLIRAEGILKSGISTYTQEQERKRLEEQRKLEAEAWKREEEAKIAEAVAATNMGDTKAVDEILNEPIEVPPVILPTATPKIQGLSTRKSWKFKVLDLSKINRQHLKVDDVKIGQMVRALGKEAEATIGGIQVWEETGVAAGRR